MLLASNGLTLASARDDTKHPTVLRGASHPTPTKNYLDQNVTSAELEKLWT